MVGSVRSRNEHVSENLLEDNCIRAMRHLRAVDDDYRTFDELRPYLDRSFQTINDQSLVSTLIVLANDGHLERPAGRALAFRFAQ